MLQTLTSSTAAASVPGMSETIKSRFGEIAVDPGKAVAFPRGLLGMPDKLNYAVVNFPNEKMQQFALLQSLDDHALSFITLPVLADNPFIGRKDIEQIARDLQIDLSNLAILLIVSVHRQPGQVKLSVNARAPLFIDVTSKVGVQHVFQHDQYKVQHML